MLPKFFSGFHGNQIRHWMSAHSNKEGKKPAASMRRCSRVGGGGDRMRHTIFMPRKGPKIRCVARCPEAGENEVEISHSVSHTQQEQYARMTKEGRRAAGENKRKSGEKRQLIERVGRQVVAQGEERRQVGAMSRVGEQQLTVLFLRVRCRPCTVVVGGQDTVRM